LKPRKPKPARPPAAAIPADPVLLGADLAAWAGEKIRHAGHETALLGKVEALRLSSDGRSVEGKVRDHGPTPYKVSVSVAGAALEARCDCAYEGGPVCKHAVATIESLRFPRPALVHVAGSQKRSRRAGRLARGQGRIVTHAPVQAGMLLAGPGEWALTREERVDLARADELKARKQRARKEKPAVVRLGKRGGALPRFACRGTAAPARIPSRCGDWRPGSRRAPALISRRARSARASTSSACAAGISARRETARSGVGSLVAPGRIDDERSGSVARDSLRYGRRVSTGGLRGWFDDEGNLLAAPPDQEPVAWVEAAIAAASRIAEEGGLAFDLDRRCSPGWTKRAATPSCGPGFARVEAGDDVWRETVTGLGFQLHPYQEDGALFLARRGRAFLADDMGLGKTLQAIVATLLMRRTVGIKKTLVVCPASLKHQWAGEIAKACGEDGARGRGLAHHAGRGVPALEDAVF
jgi:hypothetical protein